MLTTGCSTTHVHDGAQEEQASQSRPLYPGIQLLCVRLHLTLPRVDKSSTLSKLLFSHPAKSLIGRRAVPCFSYSFLAAASRVRLCACCL